ncbi:MAG: tetratricopeptide repeat protein [Oscillospiraceae bacterium]|nr:tetratricopeptide repeat protein [Oscillospiraceae bacterium]
MEAEYAMMNSPLRVRRKLAFAVTFALFFCALLVFAAEARANGNIHADWPPPDPVPPSRGTVRRAPVRQPARRAPARPEEEQKVQPQPAEPPQPSSLEMGIRMMEQARYSRAKLYLQKAVQEERDNPYAWYWYGLAHDKIGKFQQAQFFYTRALELDPAFPPFVRVVAYPSDGSRIPLWDPLRPARVYPVESGSYGVVTVPPGSPESTPRTYMPYVDPSLPRVPVYVPPDVPSPPGDAVQPPVYVPPYFSAQPPVYPMYDQITTAPIYAPPSPANPAGAWPVYTPPPPGVVSPTDYPMPLPDLPPTLR